MGPALDAYKDRLTQVKINTLQAEVTECFNRLARKSDFVKGILVDPKTFQVSVVDAHGRAIPKEDLSSGEKQIFAISMLWGLARTSGRPLPVVVDTPLGRLDSDHRIKLIENYFPEAGHQVILLSTDTEVDKSLFEKLSPAISHTYHLEYDQDEGKTGFTEAYFWRSRTGA
jgi:DNA sulfur modification protein DndD